MQAGCVCSLATGIIHLVLARRGPARPWTQGSAKHLLRLLDDGLGRGDREDRPLHFCFSCFVPPTRRPGVLSLRVTGIKSYSKWLQTALLKIHKAEGRAKMRNSGRKWWCLKGKIIIRTRCRMRGFFVLFLVGFFFGDMGGCFF